MFEGLASLESRDPSDVFNISNISNPSNHINISDLSTLRPFDRLRDHPAQEPGPFKHFKLPKHFKPFKPF